MSAPISPKKSETSNSCPICLDVFDENDKSQSFSLECGHGFHTSCLVEWLRSGQHPDCPVCRAVPSRFQNSQNQNVEDAQQIHNFSNLLNLSSENVQIWACDFSSSIISANILLAFDLDALLNLLFLLCMGWMFLCSIWGALQGGLEHLDK